MKFSYNWLQSFFKQKLRAPQKLAEILTMRFAEVEGIEKKGKDFVLDIDVRPNRAGDCFSHFGMAREIGAITNCELRIANEELKEDKKQKAKDFVSVEVKDGNTCTRYTARVITHVKVGPSPKWIQERLVACGLRPINNVVDVTNYVMLETGQPLHAFDFEKLSPVNYQPASRLGPTGRWQADESKQITNKKIIVRFAKKGEQITTLDEEKYDLDENILIIADSERPIGIAGIKGEKFSGIDEKTKIVVLESANFNPKVIRRGSQRLDLKTDASTRFEHRVDQNLTEFAINRAAFLIQEVAGGKVVSGLVDFYPKRVLPKRIQLDLNYLKSLLGMEIRQKEIQNILKRLNFKIREVEPRKILAEVPTWRLDVGMPEDLIEEIGRIQGYEKIPAAFPVSSLLLPQKNLDIFWEDFSKDILKEARFSEVYNYSFISPQQLSTFKFSSSEAVELENPLSEEQRYLRPSLLPNLLKDVAKNQRNFQEIKIFELGKIFQASKTEKRMMAGVITGETFYQLKGVIDLLLSKLGVGDVLFNELKGALEESKQIIWHPRKSAEINVKGQKIGILGEASSGILNMLEIKSKAVLFDIDFEKVLSLASAKHEYQPISKFPSAARDIAVLVPRTVKALQVLNKIQDAGDKAIQNIDLFDIYEGEEIQDGKKNLAFHITYQAEDRTLSSKEIDESQNKIIKALEEESEWQVRK